MKKHLILLSLVLLIPTATIAGETEKPSALEAFIANVSNDMARAAADWQTNVMPELEVELQKLWTNVQAEVERGYLELKALSNRLDAAAADMEAKLDAALQREDVARMKEVLSRLDDEAVRAAAAQIAAEVLAKADVAGEKLDQARQLLARDIEERGRLMEKYLAEGQDGLQAFGAENKALHDRTVESMKRLLSPAEMQQIQAWWAEKEKDIEALFAGEAQAGRAEE